MGHSFVAKALGNSIHRCGQVFAMNMFIHKSYTHLYILEVRNVAIMGNEGVGY